MKNKKSDTQSLKTTAVSTSTELLQRVSQLSEGGRQVEALELLAKTKDWSEAMRNAQAVCLMRLGRLDDAIRILRSLVLQPGCIWLRPDAPVIYRMNFATALMLSGRMDGARDCLSESQEEQHPSVERVTQALKSWESSLNLWQWVHWKLGLVPKVSVELQFTPGEIVDPLQAEEVQPPPKPQLPPGPRRRAA